LNDRERDTYQPVCQRCGQPIVDIDWLDITVLGSPTDSTPGRMRCSTDGCYNTAGSRDTSPLVPGGLTVDDHAWLRSMGVAGQEDG
jgi:hypothetical protein